MKNLLFVITLFISSLLLAQTENINECKTDIYFGNGVWNSSEEARNGQKELEIKVINKIINGDLKLQAKYGEVKLQYNTSYGSMIDILETFYQLKESGQIGEELFFSFVDELMAKQVSDITDEDIKSLREQIINLIVNAEENEVAGMVEKYYDESFKYGHRVLLVSHSQGNLFANRVYEQINPTEYKDYFANLQIASPASEVRASKGDYVTGFIDPIINPIPGSMSSNVDLDLPGGHAFVEAYLASEDSLTKIIDKTKQLLASLDTESSQWETDQELNKDTKDYKITVKHRFDSSILNMQNTEVYPFKPSGKLYYVDGNISGYVKASCGGTEISDDWEDKKEDEAYLINNIEKEKITSATLSFIVEYYYDIYHYNKSDPQGASAQKFIAPNSTCVFYETGSGYRKLTSLQSDDYYLASLDYIRNEMERYNFNRYPTGSSLSRQLECFIKDSGYALEDYTSVKRESERRYIIDNCNSDRPEKRYVLEQKYSMVK